MDLHIVNQVGTESDTDQSTGGEATSSTETGDVDTDTSETDTTAPAICGDGVVDAGESCDDDEGSFGTDPPGVNNDCKLDCGWDENLFFARYTSCGDDDLGACGSCVQYLECINPCEPEACELCFLQGADELAEGCDSPSCPDGVEPCGGPYECPEGRVCQGGCCLPFQIQ